jgi:hypothetical protein
MGGSPGLRPLSFGEILDVSLKIFGRYWQTLVACVLVPTIPIQILLVLVVLSIAPEQYDPDTDPTAAPVGTGTEIAALIVVYGLSLIASLLAWAACFKAVADGYLGAQPSLGGSLRFGLPRIPRLFGLSIVCGLMIFVGLFGCLVGALFVAALVMLSIPALLLERIGVFASIGRSFELVKGRYWQMVLMLLVVFIALIVISFVLGLVFGAVAGAAGDAGETANAIASFIASVAASAVTTPIFASVLTVLYFDQRVRKEGFDLQLLASGIGEQAPTTAQESWQQPQAQQWPPQQEQSWQQPPPAPEQGTGGTSPWEPPSSSPPSGPSSPPGPSPPPSGPSSPPPGSPGGS